MSSPAAQRVPPSGDPLSPLGSSPVLDLDSLALPDPPSLSSSPSSHQTSPMSFKKRQPSRTSGSRSGLLGGILSSSQEEPDKVPQPASNAFASRSRMPSRAIDSDEEEEDDSGVNPAGRNPNKSRWHQRKAPPGSFSTFSGAAGGGATRPQPPLRDPFLSPPLLSPSGRRSPGGGRSGGEDADAPREATPLPLVPIIVLCTAMFGEFLSASLSSPFLYFMIEDFGVGQGPGGGGEATVGFWTGVVSSVFFLSQFLTSLLWVSVAEKHGRRAVLFASLLGNGLTLMAFGTSKNLRSAITVRLAMGLFNGAVGVARSAVQSITDPSNESRAFTFMGLSWGLGGIVGSIIGGLAENPVRNHPYWFGDSVLFKEYPYLLPCLIAGSVTTCGAVLSLFLNPDGGPRTTRIQLPSEKDVSRATRTFSSFLISIVNKVRAHLPGGGKPPIQLPSTPAEELHPSTSHTSRAHLFSPADERAPFAARRPSSRFGTGSAYGYGGSQGGGGMRIPSAVGAMRRRSNRFGPMSTATSNAYAPDYDFDRGDFSFAQRLLLANEQAVFSISDLWVANATRPDNDDQYSQVDYDDSVFDEESRVEGEGDESRITLDHEDEPDFFGYGTAPPSLDDIRGTAARQELTVPDVTRSRSPSSERPGYRRAPSSAYSGGGGPGAPRDRDASTASRFRRGSVTSSTFPGGRPAIFSNTGLDEATLAGGAAAAQVTTPNARPDESTFNPMAPIPESGRAPSIVYHPSEDGDNASLHSVEPPEQSLIRQLPLGMIVQYSLLALHGCTCDQVFMSFLVTPVPSGGLGLKAANYAVLVALMFGFSMLWQFRFYPFIGPPNGKLSHLAMFRLGLAFYIPVYILFPELRGLLRENSNGFVMVGMILLSALRYLASTCSYTAVMVLVNAMSPPHLVPLANGLAQSSVSLARFIGPLLGGTLWAASIADGPNAHPWPFNYAGGFIVIAIVSFLVTPVPSGGLGLKAANYAVLVALMFGFSMLWQFRWVVVLDSYRRS